MENIMTIEEIEKYFNDEWILVVDPITDEKLKVKSGSVVCHHKDRDVVYRKAKEIKPANFAMLFTGQIPHDMEIVL
jgi:hypothetical protein